MDTTGMRFVHQHIPNTEVQGVNKPDFFEIVLRKDDEDNEQRLCAFDYRRQFQTSMEKILRDHYPDPRITLNGPAISFIISSVYGAECEYWDTQVKVDLTFGIPLNTPDTNVWPLQNPQVIFEQDLLTPVRHVRLGQIELCHFIPFGDVWRVSFAKYEGELIKSLSLRKRHFLVALKVKKHKIVLLTQLDHKITAALASNRPIRLFTFASYIFILKFIIIRKYCVFSY